jgi:hypothetical protein
MLGALLVVAVVAPVAAAQTCPGMQLTLSNNSTADHGFGVDDDVEVRLNGSLIFENNDEGASNVGSPHFTAAAGDQLRIIASNSTVFGGHEFIDSLALFCDANANVQVLEASTTEFASGAPGEIFFDRTYTIDFVDGVVWEFGGFKQPVDARPTLNSLKAGAAVPVKFSLGGDRGLDIFAPGYPKSQVIACDSAADVDGIEQTLSAGGSTLSYDATTGMYTYVWKTDKAWAGSCRQLVLGLADGSVQRANFQFR